MGQLVSRDGIFRPFAFPVPKISYTEDLDGLMFIKGTGGSTIPLVYYKGYEDNVDIKERKIVLYSHGTATDIGYSFSTVKHLSENFKIDVINYEYPGFGLFKGTPSERSCYDTVFDVYRYIRSLGYTLDNIILFGMSLGTAMSIYLARRLSDNNQLVRAVVLQAPFSSGLGVISTKVANLVSSIYNKDKSADMFLNYDNIKHVKSPIIIMHGSSDKIVPISHGIDLAKKAPQLKAFILIENGTHTNLREVHEENWLSAFMHAL